MAIEIVCNKCGAVNNYTDAGLQWRDGVKNVQRRRCGSCGKIFVLPKGTPGSIVKVKKEKVNVGKS